MHAVIEIFSTVASAKDIHFSPWRYIIRAVQVASSRAKSRTAGWYHLNRRPLSVTSSTCMSDAARGPAPKPPTNDNNLATLVVAQFCHQRRCVTVSSWRRRPGYYDILATGAVPHQCVVGFFRRWT
jgi:hypothetical protein